MKRSALAAILALSLGGPAFAQEQVPQGWTVQTYPGGIRVMGSAHKVSDPPQVIVETVERPVYVPVPTPVVETTYLPILVRPRMRRPRPPYPPLPPYVDPRSRRFESR